MDRAKIMKELLDAEDIRRMFLDHLRTIGTDYGAKLESAQHGESPEFAKNIEYIKECFGIEPSQELIFRFILAAFLALADTLTESNRKWYSVLIDEAK